MLVHLDEVIEIKLGIGRCATELLFEVIWSSMLPNVRWLGRQSIVTFLKKRIQKIVDRDNSIPEPILPNCFIPGKGEKKHSD